MIHLNTRKTFLLVPAIGSVLFVLLYIVAALNYPGGTFSTPNSSGYNWKQNYWCELLSLIANNGTTNHSRPFAIVAMVCLIISLTWFWYCAPLLFGNNKKTGNIIIQISGMCSMLVTPLLLTAEHDTVINIAGLLGMIAFISMLINFIKHKMFGILIFTSFCILLCIINNYIYYSRHFFSALPIIQKVTFLAFLSWFFVLSLIMYKKTSR